MESHKSFVATANFGEGVLENKEFRGRGDKSLRFCEIKREVNEYYISDAYNITEYSPEHILMFNHSLHN